MEEALVTFRAAGVYAGQENIARPIEIEEYHRLTPSPLIPAVLK
jgi:hypothetical protein